jgi:hypothetical protein
MLNGETLQPRETFEQLIPHFKHQKSIKNFGIEIS